MSRDTIDVRECDRCKLRLEAREPSAFDGWGTFNADGLRQDKKIGLNTVDLCAGCFDFLLDWFSEITRERDARREPKAKPVAAAIPAAVELIAAGTSGSSELDAYIARLTAIKSLDELQEYQAGNALTLMQWMADPALSESLQLAHHAAYFRLSPPTEPEDAA